VQTFSKTDDFKAKKAWISVNYPGFFHAEGVFAANVFIFGI
jgi:hypothetical protein